MDQERLDLEVDAIADKLDGKLVVSLEDEDWRRMAEEGRWAIVVKLANGMSFNIKGLANILTKIWNMENRVSFAELANNMALARFKSEDDLRKIRDGGPWLCMDSFIVMHEWCSDLAPEEFKMNRLGVWAQMHNLPVGAVLNDKEYGEKLASYIGKFIKVSQSEAEGARKRFVRVRVEIEIDKPLVTGFFLKRLNRDPLWVSVKYERLPECCDNCGRLSHAKTKCEYLKDSMQDRMHSKDMSEQWRRGFGEDRQNGEESENQVGGKEQSENQVDGKEQTGKIAMAERVYGKRESMGLEMHAFDKTTGELISSISGGSRRVGEGLEVARSGLTNKKGTGGDTMEVEELDIVISKTSNVNSSESKLLVPSVKSS